jgi:sulfur-oxidizing protein SoxY
MTDSMLRCHGTARVRPVPDRDEDRGGADQQRRGLLASVGLMALWPLVQDQVAAAAQGSISAFAATTLEEALRVIGGRPVDHDQISIRIPPVIEDGAIVPVAVSSTIPNVDALFLLVEHNPLPLALAASIPEGTEPSVTVRLKLAGSGRVHAVVRSDGMLYTRSAETRVTLGGCH